RLLLPELRIGIAHLGHQGGDDLVEEGTLGAQLVAVAAGAANDAAQHVAAASLEGVTPSAIRKPQERMWSATTLSDAWPSLTQPMAWAAALSRFWNRSMS